MAAPISEQSADLTDAITEQENMEEPSGLSSDVTDQPDSEKPAADVPESGMMSEPERQVTEPAAEPSAFHVVSYPDGHKELTTDILEACDPIAQPESSVVSSSNNDVVQTGPGNSNDELKEPATVKHFSAKVVQQEHEENSNNNLNQHTTETCLSAAEEGQILAQTENEAVEMEGVNIEDIDNAVERALLGEVGDDSCGKSAGDNSTELEIGLQAKSAELNNGSDPGQTDGSSIPQTHMMEKVYNIDEETRMGLDATPVNDQSIMKESFTYPSLPPKKLFQIDDTKDSEASDTETKLSMSMTDTEDIRLSNTISIDEGTNVSVTSDSNTDAPTPTSTRKPFRATREGIGVSQDGLSEGGERVFTAENLFEYQWPLDGGDWHLLQEQVSEYLSVKSFKRKYPDLDRRVCDKEEKDFLRDKGVVTETQSDLGLTALRSEEVYDLMMKDYNDKYQEYITFLQEKQKKVIRDKHKEYSEQAKIDKSKMESYSKKAARSAAEYNAHMMREKKDERRAYFDLQTYTVHFPKSKFSTLPPTRTKVGAYPVAILAGQYQDHIRRYSPEDLRYFPVKTVMHDPMKPVKYVRPMPESVRLAMIEKQKPPPPPEEKMEVQDVIAEDSTEDKENTVIPDGTGLPELEPTVPATESVEPVTPQVKTEKKPSVKSSSKKRPKIELSPERPKKTFKKAKESLLAAEAEVTSEENVTADGTETSKSPDGKNLIPKIHGLEKCRICKQRSTKEERKNEKIVKCAQCGKIGHTSCLDLTEELVAVIKTYPWQCMECKSCVKCLDPFDEDKMMFCDRCDRGYHTFCIGLEALPTGHWECGSCEGVVPIVLNKSKSDAGSKTNKTASEKPKEVKTEVGETLPSPAAKTHPPIEPTLQEKKELLEEGEISISDPNISTETGQEPHQAFDPDSSEAIETATPGPHVKIERRGRKRKHSMDPKKSKSSPKKPKPAATPKQDRVTGERQSRRLKLKEEEEEEKKKKEEEKMELKKKKMKKKLKKLAAEAAAAAAAEAAAAYAATHPYEDCSLMLQARDKKSEDFPSSGLEKTTETTSSSFSSEPPLKSVDKSAEETIDKPGDTETEEKLIEEKSNPSQMDEEIPNSEQPCSGKDIPQESTDLQDKSTDKTSDASSKPEVSADVSKPEVPPEADDQPDDVLNKEFVDSNELQQPESSQPAESATPASAGEIATSSTIDDGVHGETSDTQEKDSKPVDNKPVCQGESQAVTSESNSEDPSHIISSGASSPTQNKNETEPKTDDSTLVSQTGDPSISETSDPNQKQMLVKDIDPPTSQLLNEEDKPKAVEAEVAQDKSKENLNTVPLSQRSSEPSSQSMTPGVSEATPPSSSLTAQASSKDITSQSQDLQNTSIKAPSNIAPKPDDQTSSTQASLEVSQPVASEPEAPLPSGQISPEVSQPDTSNPEGPLSSAQTFPEESEPVTSKPEDPSPSSQTSGVMPQQVASTENQDLQTSSDAVSYPSLESTNPSTTVTDSCTSSAPTTQASVASLPPSVSLPETTSNTNHEGAASVSAKEDSKVMEPEKDKDDKTV